LKLIPPPASASTNNSSDPDSSQNFWPENDGGELSETELLKICTELDPDFAGVINMALLVNLLWKIPEDCPFLVEPEPTYNYKLNRPIARPKSAVATSGSRGGVRGSSSSGNFGGGKTQQRPMSAVGVGPRGGFMGKSHAMVGAGHDVSNIPHKFKDFRGKSTTALSNEQRRLNAGGSRPAPSSLKQRPKSAVELRRTLHQSNVRIPKNEGTRHK
jgi:hypothetical protein